jgi:hypothetical protein
MITSPAAIAQSCSGSDFIIQYSSYIQVDHVPGPTLCPFVQDPINSEPYIPLIYKGDAYRGTYRTTEWIQLSTATQQSTGFFRDAGETRNYDATNSPVNGSTLSNLPFGGFPSGDEDGIPEDCYLWNKSGRDDPSGYQQQTTVNPSGGTVHFWGAGANPLETLAVLAPIRWDVSVTISGNQASGTVDVTCFPAHTIKVNGKEIYKKVPDRADATYIDLCLSGIFPHINEPIVLQSVPTY